MSVACRSWEVASGPTVGFNRGIQSNLCATAPDTLSSETPNYCSNTALSHDSLMKAVVAGTDVSKGLIFPNHKGLSPQDTVTRGLSSLSLHPQSQLLAGNPTEDYKTSPSYESSNKSLELNCSIPLASNGTNFCCFAACSAEYNTHGKVTGAQKSVHHDGSGSKGFEDVPCCVSELPPHSGSSSMEGSIGPNSFWLATRNYVPLYDNYRDFEYYDFPRHTLDVVVEDKPFEESFAVAGIDELEVDSLSASSTNSISSLLDSPVDGSVSMGEEFHGVDESEAQSAFKGLSSFEKGSSPRRKGLSRFYSGKSRSYSCLGDAMSVKDLAKPENPYAKKRRCLTSSGLNTGRSQLPPLQKGSASISKKGLHSGNSTLALAVTMSSTVEDSLERGDNYESFVKAQSCRQERPSTSRSFSLSDLQRVSPC